MSWWKYALISYLAFTAFGLWFLYRSNRHHR
jgi:hypothetical protein